MKKNTLLITALLCFQCLYAGVISDLITYFGQGDTQHIAQYLNNNVELAIKNAENVFTRQQTQNILADFFKKNQPVSLTIRHQGEREHQQFVIGNLATKQGNYRVYFLVKNNLIHQLRIEESND